MAALYNLNLSNVSDHALPGETVPADPYGALATTATLTGFLSNTFSVGSFQVPYWLAGLAAIGGGVLLLGAKR